MKNNLPKIASWLLQNLLPDYTGSAELGDYEEIFSRIAANKGRFNASLWLWTQIVKSTPAFILSSLYWNINMFRNYLLIALRNIKKHKGYTFINISGLAIGMACTILIFLWVRDELSYDNFHEKSDRIFQVFQTIYIESGEQSIETSSGPLARDLKADYNEIAESGRIGETGELLLKYGGRTFIENEVACADQSIFDIFTLPFVSGDPNTALSGPRSIVLTEDAAEKYFGSENPVGKVITINGDNDFTVSGVINNIPLNSNLRYNIFISLGFMEDLGHGIDEYTDTSYNTFLLLRENIPYKMASDKIYDTFTKAGDESGLKRSYFLVPITSVHLNVGQGLGKLAIMVFSLVAGLILLIGCINFINLSTARSINRSKEVGLRKVIGAKRSQLVKQFLGESVITAFISCVIALLLVAAVLPAFNNFSGKQLGLSLFDPVMISVLIFILAFTGIFAGIFPALVLSGFKPAKVLSGSFRSGKKGAKIRKFLVVTQFFFSIFFIICTIVFTMQLDYMDKADLGFDTSGIVYVRGDKWGGFETVKSELLRNSNILSVTSSNYFPFMVNSFTVDWGRKDNNKGAIAGQINVGCDYLKTFNMKLLKGRFYSEEITSDRTESIVVTESTVNKLGLREPIGEKFFFNGKDYTIIGVVEDFFFFPLSMGMGPLVMLLDPVDNAYIFIKTNGQNTTATFDYIKSTLNKINPDYPAEVSFLDDFSIEAEELIGMINKVLMLFTILGIFISCLGLFGLASFISERRTKEIGIRKALGASVGGIIALLSKEFAFLLIIANILAWPLSYFVMKMVLEYFSYRIGLEMWIFFVTGGGVFLTALITVSFQAVKAARANPVSSLRYE